MPGFVFDVAAPNRDDELVGVFSDCGLLWPKRLLVLCCALPNPPNTEDVPADVAGGGPAGVVEGFGEKNEVGFAVAGVPKLEKGDAPLIPVVFDI